MSVIRTALFVTACAVATPVAAATPIAEVVCAPSEEMAQRLTQQHGVTRQGLGLRDPDSRMELWSSQKTGDWTLVVAYASGRSCIVAMGRYWEETDPA